MGDFESIFDKNLSDVKMPGHTLSDVGGFVANWDVDCVNSMMKIFWSFNRGGL